MIVNSSLRDKLITTHTILKWLEIAVLATLLLMWFWIFYNSSCELGVCATGSIQSLEQQVIQYWSWFIPVGGVVNLLRAAVLYVIEDPDQDSELPFYLAIGGISIAYVIIGVFISEFVQNTQLQIFDSPAWIAVLFALMAGFSLILLDTKNWEKASSFVKSRIAFSALIVITILFSPMIGILLWAVLIPALVLWHDVPRQLEMPEMKS